MNSDIYMRYSQRLLKIGINSFKKYHIKQTVKKFKKKKWQKLLNGNLKVKYFHHLKTVVRELRVKNKEKRLKYMEANSVNNQKIYLRVL
tara:strand:+ start:138 stop:404 length:267 start_codon:yes stop_codon:yes gene_type:complete